MKAANFKRLIFFLFMFVLILSASAQGNGKKLYFIYIDHEETTPVGGDLINNISELKTNNSLQGDAFILYLANGFEPLYYCQNVEGIEASYTSDDAYYRIIAELQESVSNDTEPNTDMRTVLDLFDIANLTTDNGELNYSSVTMDFYLGPDFWNRNLNQKFLSRLYFALEVKKMDSSRFKFNLYRPRDMKEVYRKGMAFGAKNIEDLNKKTIAVFE